MKTYKIQDEKAVEVKEKFVAFGGMKQLDSKDRISIGGPLKKMITDKMAVEGFQVFFGADGDILLRPAVSIPASEAWAYKNPKVIGKLHKGLEDARDGRTVRVHDVDEYLKKL